MSYSRDGRSASPRASISPGSRRRSRSMSLSRSRRSRSRSRDSVDAANPGNNLYVTGLSTRVTTADLEKYFGAEGKIHGLQNPVGLLFVTMENTEGADRCIKYLNRSVLEGRLITVEKAKRSRGRTPTPGRYHGLRERRGHGHRRSRSYSPHRWHDRYRDPYSRERQGRSRSPYGRKREEDSYKRRRDRSWSAERSYRR